MEILRSAASKASPRIAAASPLSVSATSPWEVPVKPHLRSKSLSSSPAWDTGPFSSREAVNPEEDTAARVGDEPLLLAREAATVVSRNREWGAKFIENGALGSVIVMDDGFQNPSLAKDLRLVVIDGKRGLGSGQVFPLGPLRMPLPFQARNVDAIIIMGGAEDFPGEDKLAESLREAKKPVALIRVELQPLADHGLERRRVLAFCGIGNPSKFYATLANAGAEVAQTKSFPDHYRYTQGDASALLHGAQTANAKLVTTEKDYARLSGVTGDLAVLRSAAMPFPVAVQVEPAGEARLLGLISNAVQK